jgi:hypothetical protein
VRESEGGQAALWFSSIRVREGGRQWHATRPDGLWRLGRPEEGEKILGGPVLGQNGPR